MVRGGWVAPVCTLFVLACGPTRKAMSAGQVGCQEAEIEISDESSSFGSETWVATCNERRYVCSKVKTGQVYGEGVYGSAHQVNCTAEGGGGDGDRSASAAPTPAASAQATGNHTEPPQGAAGFELGKTVAETSALCTGKEHAWAELGAGKFQCAGLPEDIGLAGHAVLSFCKGVLCGIELVTQPAASGKSLAGSFRSLSEALDQKYGNPEKRENEVPSDCREQQAFSDCLKQGRARFLRTWAWTSGERVTLTLGAESEDSIVYTLRPSGFRPKTDAL
jgi:hypothetical protein